MLFRLKINKKLFLFYLVVPNGASTGIDISFSNKALVYISTSFYTMVKSTSPMFLLMFAFAWGIEELTWQLFGIILTICTGTYTNA